MGLIFRKMYICFINYTACKVEYKCVLRFLSKINIFINKIFSFSEKILFVMFYRNRGFIMEWCGNAVYKYVYKWFYNLMMF